MADDAAMGEPAAEAPFRWRRLIKPVITVAIFAALAAGLRSMLASFDYDDVIAGFDAVPAGKIALAAGLVALVHALYVVRERLAIDFAGEPRLPTRRVAVASLISRSLSTLGLATITGFALRVRLYEQFGIDKAAVTRATIYNEATFYVGLVASIALAFSLGGLPPMIGTSVRLPSLAWVGPIAVALLVAYLGYGVVRQTPLQIRSFTLPPLRPVPLVAQVALPLIDTLLAAAITTALVPAAAGLGYRELLAIGVVAGIAGSISQVPGGLGVYETTVLAFVPTAAHPATLAALLVRRAMVQLLPIVVGTLLLVGVAVATKARRHPNRVALDFARDAMAIATFAASVLSLIAAAVPRHNGLTAMLGVPGQAIVFASGLATLVAARGLQQGRRRAWWVCVVLFALRTGAALLSGHLPSVIIAGAITLVLLIAVQVFPHPGPLFDGERTWWTAWLVALIGIAWVADAHPDTLSTEVRARTTGMIVAVALILGSLVARALPERRRRKKRKARATGP